MATPRWLRTARGRAPRPISWRPGDTIVVSVPMATTLEEAHRVHAQVASSFPGCPVLVKPHEVDVAVLRRGGDR